MRVRYSLRAREDLKKILQYIDERNPQGADSVKRGLRKVTGLIGQFPHGGRSAGEDDVRVVPVGRFPYAVYWVASGSEVVIVHIRHTAQREWGGE
jgi:toxin ParE1/3/4